ncbi:hypothetical protein FGU65_01610 [Methanoculleus sp. FWC-SCC1]|uniref:Uncharacterized protein n=1 Tax=Methanoculleus frigidifontis TaxID=2584085 RepID=A0ABT8M6P3_9EURY|nr:hypothetical protein [Methanoculleus sp. FWC-SCC1]MDN7023606.1 hypothetical protein [Methanoculleus sp. FWC-SCC1]
MDDEYGEENLIEEWAEEEDEAEVLELTDDRGIFSQTGIYNVNIQNIPCLLLNVFGAKDTISTPRVDVIPFILPYSLRGYMGGSYCPEQFCIRCEYRGRVNYYRLEWYHAEGPYGIRFSGPFEIWRSHCLDIDMLKGAKLMFQRDIENGWVSDIFDRKDNSDRQKIGLIPIVLDQSSYILFQWKFKEHTQHACTRYVFAEVIPDNDNRCYRIPYRFGLFKDILKSNPNLKKYFQKHPELKPKP